MKRLPGWRRIPRPTGSRTSAQCQAASVARAGELLTFQIFLRFRETRRSENLSSAIMLGMGAQGIEVLVKVVDGLGLHVAALQIGVSPKLLRRYRDGVEAIPAEIVRQCADVLAGLARSELEGPSGQHT